MSLATQISALAVAVADAIRGMAVAIDSRMPKSGGTFTGPIVYPRQYIHVQDRRASGTASQASSPNADVARELQTVLANTIPGATLTDNAIGLPAGSYIAHVVSSAGSTLQTINSVSVNAINCSARLYDVTHSAELGYSINMYTLAGAASAHSHPLIINAEFTLTEAASLQVQHKLMFQTTASGGYMEVYADVMIEQVG